MSIVFAMLALVPGFAANATAEDEPPAWAMALIEEQGEVLAGIIGLPRVPFIELSYDGPTAIRGQRIIDAVARPERITVALAGSWDEDTPDARRQLTANLAHELAHVWQFSLGAAGEGRFFHEGFAEAIAYDVLARCGRACGGDADTLFAFQQQHCADALRSGILIAQDTRSAAYGCGAVLIIHAASNTDGTTQDLYRSFAATERTSDDFLAVVREEAGQRFSTSAFNFLYGDHRLAPSAGVMQRLRSGRL